MSYRRYEAAKTVKLVRQVWKVPSEKFRIVCSARDIERQFSGVAVPVLPATLIDRAAYRALFSLGGSLHELEPSDVSGLGTAKDNAHKYAQAVINTIMGWDV